MTPAILQQPETFTRAYSRWAESFTDAPPQFHRMTAYWVLSTLLGRRAYLHLGDDWLFPNLWLVVLAPSSFYRKSTALSIGAKMVNAVNPGIILPSEFSQECLVALMQQQPHGALVSYEFRSLLALMQKDYNSGLQSFLTEIYDSPPEYLRKTGTKEIKEYRIEKPYLTIMGASTLDWLLQSVQGGDIAGGFLARFLFVSADTKSKVLAFQPPADQAQKGQLIETLKRLAGSIKGSGRMEYALEARRYYEQWYSGFCQKAETAPDAVRAFFPRLTAYAHKFAMLEAVMAGHYPQITLQDCRTACLIAESFAAEIRSLGAQSLGKSKFEAIKIRLLNSIKRHPGADKRMLLRNMNLSAKVFGDVEQTIRQTGEVEIRDGCYYLSDVGGNA
ncbi:MAG: DUF3987 domain-containing protein [Elusimicrobia bacterium]|nr:DUF3987 domain-containing protein [Elusimicrobiota bacterium]